MFFRPSFHVYFEAFKLYVILSKISMYIDIKIEISAMSIDMQKKIFELILLYEVTYCGGQTST